ncbi:hypothetical protein AAY473_025385 [Plecturocebus cupreus]
MKAPGVPATRTAAIQFSACRHGDALGRCMCRGDPRAEETKPHNANIFKTPACCKPLAFQGAKASDMAKPNIRGSGKEIESHSVAQALECSGAIIAHCSFELLGSRLQVCATTASYGYVFLLFVHKGSRYVAQAGLKLLGSSDSCTLASQSSRIVDTHQKPQFDTVEHCFEELGMEPVLEEGLGLWARVQNTRAGKGRANLLRRLRQENHLNPGGGGCNELRLCHCSPARAHVKTHSAKVNHVNVQEIHLLDWPGFTCDNLNKQSVCLWRGKVTPQGPSLGGGTSEGTQDRCHPENREQGAITATPESPKAPGMDIFHICAQCFSGHPGVWSKFLEKTEYEKRFNESSKNICGYEFVGDEEDEFVKSTTNSLGKHLSSTRQREQKAEWDTNPAFLRLTDWLVGVRQWRDGGVLAKAFYCMQ